MLRSIKDEVGSEVWKLLIMVRVCPFQGVDVRLACLQKGVLGVNEYPGKFGRDG